MNECWVVEVWMVDPSGGRPELLRACLQVEEVRLAFDAPPEKRLDPRLWLACSIWIHTVGPFYRNADISPLLRAAYESSFQLARQAKVRSVVSAISCGVAISNEGRSHCDSGGPIRAIRF